MAKILCSLLETSQAIDLTDEAMVLGFEIGGTEPVGSSRRVIFEVDGKLFYFKGGQLYEYPCGKTFDDVIENGSTIEELKAVKDIPQWVGKKIYPIIALSAPKSSPAMPSIKLGIKVSSSQDIYQREIFSPIYKLKLTGERGKIISCDANAAITGKASCVVYVRLKNNGVWGDWITPQEAIFQYATEVQFKALQIVTALDGTDSASVEGVQLIYSTDSDKISASPAEIFTINQCAEVGLQNCAIIIRHDELKDAEISARTIYSTAIESRENILLGAGNGVAKEFVLPDANVIPESIKIYCDGVLAEDFYFDTENSTVQVAAEMDSQVTASYDFGGEFVEVEMQKESTRKEGEHYVTRFFGGTDLQNYCAATAVVSLARLSGSVENQSLGEGGGVVRQFIIPQKAEKLTCTGDFLYNEETQTLTVKSDGEIFVSYDWRGEIPKVYHLEALWGI